MLYYYHYFLYLTFAIFSWAKLYIAFQKKRNKEERKFEIIFWSILALMFTFGLIDLVQGNYILRVIDFFSRLFGGG